MSEKSLSQKAHERLYTIKLGEVEDFLDAHFDVIDHALKSHDKLVETVRFYADMAQDKGYKASKTLKEIGQGK